MMGGEYTRVMGLELTPQRVAFFGVLGAGAVALGGCGFVRNGTQDSIRPTEVVTVTASPEATAAKAAAQPPKDTTDYITLLPIGTPAEAQFHQNYSGPGSFRLIADLAAAHCVSPSDAAAANGSLNLPIWSGINLVQKNTNLIPADSDISKTVTVGPKTAANIRTLANAKSPDCGAPAPVAPDSNGAIFQQGSSGDPCALVLKNRPASCDGGAFKAQATPAPAQTSASIFSRP